VTGSRPKAPSNYRTETKNLWSCGQFACGEPGCLPWKTLRVSHRAALCPQHPQIAIYFNMKFKNRTYKTLKVQRKAREAEGIPGFLAFDFPCASVVDGFFMGF
jgi:hypothetical protein